MSRKSQALLLVIALAPAGLGAQEAAEKPIDGTDAATACKVLEQLAEIAIEQDSAARLRALIESFKLLENAVEPREAIARCIEYFGELESANAEALGGSSAAGASSSNFSTGSGVGSGGFTHSQPEDQLLRLLRDKGITVDELTDAVSKGMLENYQDPSSTLPLDGLDDVTLPDGLEGFDPGGALQGTTGSAGDAISGGTSGLGGYSGGGSSGGAAAGGGGGAAGAGGGGGAGSGPGGGGGG